MTAIRARLGVLTVGDAAPVAIMGIINRDPHSFFRGSYFRTQHRALDAVERMIDAGADILDIGGVSTAPGSPPVPVNTEVRRVIPLIKEIGKQWDIPLSIDTQRSLVADLALQNGVTIVNDVSGLKSDPTMAEIINDAGASCILMASRHQPGDCHTLSQICDALLQSMQIASAAGIPTDRIVVDPGIGFGKSADCDLAILRNLHKVRMLSRPILIGVSRKTFIGSVLGYSSPDQRLAGTIAASTIALLEGAHVLRSHDIRETRDCIKIVHAIRSDLKCEL